MPKLKVLLLRLAGSLLFFTLSAFPQPPRLTTPQEALGFNIGDDYQMASYSQLESWWKKLAAESIA